MKKYMIVLGMAFLASSIIAFSQTPPAASQPASQPSATTKTADDNTLDEKTKALFEKYKSKYALVDKQFVRLPDFDLRYLSSQTKLPYPMSGKKAGLESAKIGDFGWVFGGDILQILGPDEMLVTLWKTTVIRFKGWETKGLTDNTFWDGGDALWIAVVGTWQYINTQGAKKTVLTAIPLDQVRKGLTAEQFKELLKKGVDPEKDNP